MIKLSFIIPVYNAAPYLNQCIDAILAQEDKCTLEIIAVNDGSTDASTQILDAYQAQYPQIFKVFHRKNSGVYATRNFALTQVTGDYVWMLDADDYLLADALNHLTKLLAVHKDVDIVNFGYIIENQKGETYHKHAESATEITNGETYLTHNFGNFFLWRNVYRTRFLKNHGLKFNAQVFSLEDSLFNIRAFSLAKSVFVSEKAIYFYRFNASSISKKSAKSNRLKQGKSSIYVHQQLKNDLQKLDPKGTLYPIINAQLSHSVLGFFYSLWKEKYDLAYIKKVYQIYEDNAILPLSNQNYSFKLAVFCSMVNLRWPFVLLCKFIKH